jgi:hypothetical protein
MKVYVVYCEEDYRNSDILGVRSTISAAKELAIFWGAPDNFREESMQHSKTPDIEYWCTRNDRLWFNIAQHELEIE